jgi:hypothetical protein
LPAPDLPRVGAGLLAGARPRWLCAELIGPAALLGRWERGRVAAGAVRRLAGGRELAIGARAVVVLLALPRWDALGSPDAARVLNRHVRPLRAALAAVLRQPVAYFGRDHLVSAGRPVAWIGHAAGPGGAALVEAIVGVDGPAPPLGALAEALAHAAGAAAEPAAEPPALGRAPAEEDEAGFVASAVAPVPIGSACALVRHDGARVVAARLCGEAMGPLDALGAALAGVALDEDTVRAALTQAAAVPGFFLHGVRDVGLYAELVASTRAAALAALEDKYATLAALRARRDTHLAEGHDGFDDAEHAERGRAFRALAGPFPGALRQLEALPAATLAARAHAVAQASSRDAPVAEPWIRADLDFHGTLAAVLAAKRRLAAGPRPPGPDEAAALGLPLEAALRLDRPPRGRLLELVWDEVAARQGAPRARRTRCRSTGR